MRTFTLCAALAAFFTLFPLGSGQATSPDTVRRLKDTICSLSQEKWVEPETVDVEAGEIPAYDMHHTMCILEFVAHGQWHKFEHRQALHVSRNHGWSEIREDSLMVMVWQIDASDAQNTMSMVGWHVEDRLLNGRAMFGLRDTYRGTTTAEHFYMPSNDPSRDPCVAEACLPSGLEYAEGWQRFYAEEVAKAESYLKISLR